MSMLWIAALGLMAGPTDGKVDRVRLALEAERLGRVEERFGYLARALENDPNDARALGLLGAVAGGEGDGLEAARDEYRARRGKVSRTAEGHVQLALWCRERGLKAEATAHDTAASRLDPSASGAWRRLGMVRVEGAGWMSPEGAEAHRREVAARERADRRWGAELPRLRRDLADPKRRKAAEEALIAIDDPRAVPAIGRVLGNGGPADQVWAASLLGRFETPEAARGLGLLALSGATAEVRRAAVETLARRGDVGPLVGALRDAIPFEWRGVGGPGSPGALLVGGDRFDTLRVYDAPLPDIARVDGVYAGLDAQGRGFNSLLLRYDLAVAAAASGARLAADVEALSAANAAIDAANRRLGATLGLVAGVDLGGDPATWRAWWADRLGQTAPSEARRRRPVVVQGVPSPYQPREFARVDRWSPTSCFAAGTPVQTDRGPVPIERVQVGDLALGYDPSTGALSAQPVVAVHRNPPSATLRVRLGFEAIVATPIHRFWRAGEGWAMARDLKVGDLVRARGAVVEVLSVEAGPTQKVYNLEVAANHSYLVGTAGALVHDNTLVGPVARPFDALGR